MCPCSHGGFILCDFLCDGKKDCPNDISDEQRCQCNYVTGQICKFINNGKKRIQCSSFYYMTKTQNCEKYKEIPNLEYSVDEVKHFQCSDNENVSEILLNDLIPDCHTTNKDEDYLKSLLSFEKVYTCNYNYELPCLEGHDKCFNVTDICIYRLNYYFKLEPCRNGAHIENCKHFECSIMFKCPDAYCLPWSYVCDGKWDCPDGDDETNNPVCGFNISCQSMYKCKGTSICLHYGNICDNKIDCLYGDDEYFCNIKDISCLRGCQCLLYAINCHNSVITEIAATRLINFICVFTQSTIIPSLYTLFNQLKNAQYLKLSNSNITKLCGLFPIASKVIVLNFEQNSLSSLTKHCLFSLPYLTVCDVNSNKIAVIASESFHNLSYFKALNLSGNPLKSVARNIFIVQRSLTLLEWPSKESDTQYNLDSFFDISIKIFLTEDLHICCLIPLNYLCTSQSAQSYSCSDILPTNVLKNIYRIVSATVLILNLQCILLYYFLNNRNVYSTIILSLNFSNILCSIFICIIWLLDSIHDGIYFLKYKQWRSSIGCYTIFFIVLLYSFVSQIIQLLASLSRVLVVMYPLKVTLVHHKYIVKILVLIWTLSILLCGSFTYIVLKTTESLPFSLCLPFFDPTGNIKLIRILTWLIAFIQWTSSALITVMHVQLCTHLSQAKKNDLKSLKKNDTSIKTTFVQLSAIAISNILCCFPTNAIFIAVMYLRAHTTDLILWAAVLGLPINAFLSPFIFITVYMKTKFKRVKIDIPL